MPGLGVFHAERSVESRELREKPLVSTRRRETPFLSDSLLDLSKADSPLSANPGREPNVRYPTGRVRKRTGRFPPKTVVAD
jgi:hypothetical protein